MGCPFYEIEWKDKITGRWNLRKQGVYAIYIYMHSTGPRFASALHLEIAQAIRPIKCPIARAGDLIKEKKSEREREIERNMR